MPLCAFVILNGSFNAFSVQMLFIIFQEKSAKIPFVFEEKKTGKVIAINAHFMVKSITSASNKVLFSAHNYPASDTRYTSCSIHSACATHFVSSSLLFFPSTLCMCAWRLLSFHLHFYAQNIYDRRGVTANASGMLLLSSILYNWLSVCKTKPEPQHAK